MGLTHLVFSPCLLIITLVGQLSGRPPAYLITSPPRLYLPYLRLQLAAVPHRRWDGRRGPQHRGLRQLIRQYLRRGRNYVDKKGQNKSKLEEYSSDRKNRAHNPFIETAVETYSSQQKATQIMTGIKNVNLLNIGGTYRPGEKYDHVNSKDKSFPCRCYCNYLRSRRL